jgi:hypothetical protein
MATSKKAAEIRKQLNRAYDLAREAEDRARNDMIMAKQEYERKQWLYAQSKESLTRLGLVLDAT